MDHGRGFRDDGSWDEQTTIEMVYQFASCYAGLLTKHPVFLHQLYHKTGARVRFNRFCVQRGNWLNWVNGKPGHDGIIKTLGDSFELELQEGMVSTKPTLETIQLVQTMIVTDHLAETEFVVQAIEYFGLNQAGSANVHLKTIAKRQGPDGQIQETIYDQSWVLRLFDDDAGEEQVLIVEDSIAIDKSCSNAYERVPPNLYEGGKGYGYGKGGNGRGPWNGNGYGHNEWQNRHANGPYPDRHHRGPMNPGNRNTMPTGEDPPEFVTPLPIVEEDSPPEFVIPIIGAAPGHHAGSPLSSPPAPTRSPSTSSMAVDEPVALLEIPTHVGAHGAQTPSPNAVDPLPNMSEALAQTTPDQPSGQLSWAQRAAGASGKTPVTGPNTPGPSAAPRPTTSTAWGPNKDNSSLPAKVDMSPILAKSAPLDSSTNHHHGNQQWNSWGNKQWNKDSYGNNYHKREGSGPFFPCRIYAANGVCTDRSCRYVHDKSDIDTKLWLSRIPDVENTNLEGRQPTTAQEIHDAVVRAVKNEYPTHPAVKAKDFGIEVDWKNMSKNFCFLKASNSLVATLVIACSINRTIKLRDEFLKVAECEKNNDRDRPSDDRQERRYEDNRFQRSNMGQQAGDRDNSWGNKSYGNRDHQHQGHRGGHDRHHQRDGDNHGKGDHGKGDHGKGDHAGDKGKGKGHRGEGGYQHGGKGHDGHARGHKGDGKGHHFSGAPASGKGHHGGKDGGKGHGPHGRGQGHSSEKSES